LQRKKVYNVNLLLQLLQLPVASINNIKMQFQRSCTYGLDNFCILSPLRCWSLKVSKNEEASSLHVILPQ